MARYLVRSGGDLLKLIHFTLFLSRLLLYQLAGLLFNLLVLLAQRHIDGIDFSAVGLPLACLIVEELSRCKGIVLCN